MSGQDESVNESTKPELVGVERPAIEWLKKLGYTHVKGSQVEQVHKTEPVILDAVLVERLHALNPWLAEVKLEPTLHAQTSRLRILVLRSQVQPICCL